MMAFLHPWERPFDRQGGHVSLSRALERVGPGSRLGSFQNLRQGL
jgi:hypothetical protein